MDEPTASSSARRRGAPRGPNPANDGLNAQDVVDNGRARKEAVLAAQHAGRHQPAPVQPAASVDRGTGLAFSSWGVPCLIPALRNVHLPKDFKGPRKVPNYTADQPPEAWVESYEMAMEMLDVDEAACQNTSP